ncbi:metallophosphoesterase [Paenibacillus sp. GSMTC-2017]|uniref:metallophosphoesterase n=1 Tax=Paenibacillus sp. GSMTC-2017 TaxID=2794350 RepID=UPI0018D91664|nr:metallophosphoesterase [Paenibacillus sp. GSMTC-2017]MBH5316836.1 metallophosphoesterase [Paenibacillus sp. GSMTC-2017]
MILFLALVVCMFVYLIYHTYYVKYSTIVLKNESNMPFTIVQLSDIHGQTRFINGSLSSMVNSTNPDYVVITGDLISNIQQLNRVLIELQKINCRNILFVPGNYEREGANFFKKRLYTQEEHEHIVQSLRNQGIVVLNNSGVLIERAGKQILFYGFDNSIYGNEKVTISKKEIQNADHIILLAHSPSIINLVDLHHLPYDLLLVGHTHGGQIRICGRTFGSYKNFHVGLTRFDELKNFYINRGLGTVKIPVRFFCPPEIAVFRYDHSQRNR